MLWHEEPAGAGGGGWYGGSSGTWDDDNGSGGGGSSYAWTNTVTVDGKTLDAYYPTANPDCSAHKPATSFYLTNVTATANSNTGNGSVTISLVK